MLPKIKLLPLMLILLLFGCAVQGPATGGPIDKKGPVLISIQPQNGSLNIATDQKVTLIFDELLDPVSIPASIQIEFNLDYKLKIRGRKLIIIPEKNWPENGIVRINLSRKIRDYQKNMMDKPIQLILSTGSNIPVGVIGGDILGIDTDKLIEVGLYEWPPSTQSTYVQKVEADETGSFQLTGIENGRYTIIALEGIISDIGKQIRKKNYAMLTSSYITISSEENEKNVKMLLSKPVEKLKITSVEMQSQYCCQLTLDDNSKELIIIDSLLSPGDSIFIHLEKSNRLEAYQVLEYSFILPEIRDTLAPVLSQSFFESDIFTLIFSEPINLNVNAIVSTQDSVDISIPFGYKNEFSIIIPNIPDTVKKIQLLGEHIQDWAGNIFPDSLKILRITRPEIEDELKNVGNIIGFVNYDDNYPIKIEAQKIGSDSKHFVNVNNKKYKFSNLSSGLYKLWGFEEINNLDGEVYNSGIWSPYQRAARFAFYPDTIDVRARWDVEGIIIDFNSLQKMDQSLKIINLDTIDNKTTLTNKRKNTNDNKPYKVGNEKIDNFVDQSYELTDQLDKIINNLDETNKMLNEISSYPGGASEWSKSKFFKEIENTTPLDIAGELREYLSTLKKNLESLPEDVKKIGESFINLSKVATELPPELKTLSYFKMFKAFFTIRSTLKELKKIPNKIENIKSNIDSISGKINHILSKL